MPEENIGANIHSGIKIRPATEVDQPTITAMIRTADINPMGLDWRRFLVAEEQGQIVGIGQIKPHGDGSRELASIAVSPDRQHQGIATRLIEALVASESGPLYLMCRQQLEGFYSRFGFNRLTGDQMPPYFRRMTRLAAIIIFVASRLRHEEIQLIVMKRNCV
jgi:N-acetylglutamate synthase-like GNAT family acetyltransferase